MAQAIIPWMGGKRRLAKFILPKIENYRTYVEPFCGGASLFFMKTPSKVEVINDLNGELVNLYRVIRHHKEELIKQFEWQLISRESFDNLKNTNPSTLTDIQRAARFYVLIKMGFGGRVTKPSFGAGKTRASGFNPSTLERDIEAAHKRMAQTIIENRPWHECVPHYDTVDTCFYLDPPYWQTAGYGCDFPFEEYERMAEFMRAIKGRMVISINDHPDIRKVFAGFNMEELQIKYTIGAKNAKQAGEILITN